MDRHEMTSFLTLASFMGDANLDSRYCKLGAIEYTMH